jgi:hypothetical protein
LADKPFTHLVMFGSSAGGIGALSGLVSSLPGEFDAPIVVAQRLTVGLDITSEEVSGYVEDDGRGFGGNGGPPDGLGLSSARERAALLEGCVEIYPSPEGGAGVRVRLPLQNGVG